MEDNKKDADVSVAPVLKASYKLFVENINLMLSLGILLIIPSVLMNVGFNYFVDVNEASNQYILRPGTVNFFDGLGPSTFVILGSLSVLWLLYNVFTASVIVSSFMELLKTRKTISFYDAVELGAKNFFKVFIVGLLFFISVGFGLLLFLIPGIILFFLFIYSFNIVVDKKMSAPEAMNASTKLFSDNKGITVLFVLSLFGIAILASIIMSIPVLIVSSILPELGQVFSAIVEAAINLFTAFAFTYFYLKMTQTPKSSSNS